MCPKCDGKGRYCEGLDGNLVTCDCAVGSLVRREPPLDWTKRIDVKQAPIVNAFIRIDPEAQPSVKVIQCSHCKDTGLVAQFQPRYPAMLYCKCQHGENLRKTDQLAAEKAKMAYKPVTVVVTKASNLVNVSGPGSVIPSMLVRLKLMEAKMDEQMRLLETIVKRVSSMDS